MVGKIYADVLVDKVCRVTEELIDDEQVGFRTGKVFVDQIFTLQQKDEKAWEKKYGFCGLEKAYYSINSESPYQVLRIYDVVGKLLKEIKSMELRVSVSGLIVYNV